MAFIAVVMVGNDVAIAEERVHETTLFDVGLLQRRFFLPQTVVNVIGIVDVALVAYERHDHLSWPVGAISTEEDAAARPADDTSSRSRFRRRREEGGDPDV